MIVFRKIIFLFIFSALSCGFIQAQETGGLKGRIFNEREKGLSGVSVTAKLDDKDIKTVSTANNGEFVIDGLQEGKYSFVFAKQGFNTGTLSNVEIRKKKIRKLGNKILETDEGMLVIIKGGVFDRNGKSIYGAKVEVEKVGVKTKTFTDTTSQSGEFTFRFPQESQTYKVTASAKGKTATKEVTVSNAAIYRLALTLDIER